jgi:magnesium transporter
MKVENMYYLIKNTLVPCTKYDVQNTDEPYVAIVTRKEWQEDQDTFDMGIETEPGSKEILVTQAEINYDSITGTFSIPNRDNLSDEDYKFAFALDEKGIVFIDNTEITKRIIRDIQITKKWKVPSYERFIYDFLIEIIKRDLTIMENYERELDNINYSIIYEESDLSSRRLNQIRADIRDLSNHYDQLIDFGEILEENENNFFKEENLRYFRSFINRIDRLYDRASSIKDYTIQVRDIYRAQLDIKQNRIMTILTIVTTIFTPLMFIVGWYGMNFKYMPELNMPNAYPGVMIACIVISIISLLFFKQKKWL